jgi:hypothetical protein
MERISRPGVLLASLAWLCSGLALAAAFDDAVPLVNWTAPPYWSAPAGPGGEGRKHLETVGTPSLSFHAVTPCRIADTRGIGGFTGPYGPPHLTAGAVRSFVVTSPSTSCGIPSGAAAVSFNFAVVTMSANGNLVVYPSGAPAPTVSSLNWTPSELAISNAAVIPLGPNSIDVVVNGPVGSSTELVIDVNGYYNADPVVTSLNGNSGALSLVPSGDVTVTPGSPNITIGTNATSANTANTIVRRDPAGNFVANTVSVNTLHSFGAVNADGAVSGDTISAVGAISAGGAISATGAISAGGAISATGAISAGGGYTQPGTGADTLKVVRGIFSGTGATFSGVGFTATRNSAGDYSVNFANIFSDFPAIQVTLIAVNGLVLTFSSIGNGSFHIITLTPGGVPADPSYVSFVAVGHP